VAELSAKMGRRVHFDVLGVGVCLRHQEDLDNPEVASEASDVQRSSEV